MNNKGQLQLLLNPRNLVYIFGFAILGYMFFGTIFATVIGGVIGAVVSLIR